MSLKESAIHYMGNKWKLLPQILPLFPKGIGNFYDLFGGSATVSLNVKADKCFINDLSGHIYNLYNMFKSMTADDIIKYCREMRDKWGFVSNETDRSKFVPVNREIYNRCRDWMNENPSTIGYYFLTFYSFCNQFRFNGKKFNISAGNGYYKEKSEFLIKQMCEFFRNENVFISNLEFDKFDFGQFDATRDFVYLDPPYSACEGAVYNVKREISGWGGNEDKRLFSFCDRLNGLGFKFAMSNVFLNKGYENVLLKEWCQKNGYEIYHLSASYGSHSKETAEMEVDEVLICNYKSLSNRLF